MNINIRTANINDVETLQKLDNEVFIDNHKYDPDLEMSWALGNEGNKFFSEILTNNESLAFIAEVDGMAVGYIACSPKKISYRKSRYFEIDNMGVSPEYRSQGIGTMLINKVKEWAKEKGFQKLFVNSYFGNIKAIEFYKRQGFVEIDISLETAL